MYSIVKTLLLCVLLGLLLLACSYTSDTLYLQEADVYGPVNQPPVSFMNDNQERKISFSPKIYLNGENKLNGRVSGHSRVNRTGIFAVDSILDESGYILFTEKQDVNRYDYEGQNLTWHTPEYMIGFDLDYYMTSKFILTGGLSLSEAEQNNLFGWRLGMGMGGFHGDIGIRFDIGLIWQEYEYAAETIVVQDHWSLFESSERRVYFFTDRGKSTNLNYYFSVNLHYADKDAVINPFIGLAYSNQKILEFEPRESRHERFPVYSYYNTEDLRGDASVSYLIITPGAYFHVNNWIKLVASAKYFFAGNINNVSKENFVVPTLQLDFMF